MTHKKYVKPDVEKVAFNMTSNISGGCGTIGGKSGSFTSCTFDMGSGVVLFLTAETGCVFVNNEPNVCYDVPTADTIVFSS